MNRRNAPKKLLTVMSMTNSRWIARTTMQVKTHTYVFTNSWRASGLLARIGPAKSTPTCRNGPVGVTRSAGSSPIFWPNGWPTDRRHVTHCLMTFFTALLPLVIQ
ncbi:hypothetical protein T10_543 [Trichinella papuae]|uniref:Uncharacterized protein n=1 Tax=Trichinella papuae TaxID=268474 RepID=A0A0V1M5H2_9BILA|nr:hypothetical protein T10_4778 [Trichinella papuae]KRZ66626.1 hypothetical protein T10_543 [Trichinella papuae]